MTFLRAKHFSLLHLLILCCLAIAALAAIDHFRHAPETAPAEAQNCPVDVHRIQGLRYVRPIVFVSDGCESHELAGIKQQVNEIIARYQAAGDVNIVSVYLRNADGWTSVNPAEQYQPGSLFKVPLMIVALRMNEMDPGFLDRKIVFARPFGLAKKVNIKGKSIELGKSYTIRELMGYMIRESDNQATALL
jgi:beta-lactamase class A